MSSFSYDQKVALLVVPMLLFGVLGMGGGYAPSFGEDGVEMRRGHLSGSREVTKSATANLLLTAIRTKDYRAFVRALANTPYALYTEREIFDVLVHTYELQREGKGVEAEDNFIRMLYG